MRSPFPGMDPYLEHPSLWPDVHNRLLAAIAEELVPRVAPRYFVGLERRTYAFDVDDLALIGVTDLGVGATHRPCPPRRASEGGPLPEPEGGLAVLDVAVPTPIGGIGQNYLEIREVRSGSVVTVLELLSPANKVHAEGRSEYERKRGRIFESVTNLVEVDLHRAGKPMPVDEPTPPCDYRILVSRGDLRPRARLYAFSVRVPIPEIPVPLLPEDGAVDLDLNGVLHGLYIRARFDLRLDYDTSPVPPLGEADAAWAAGLIAEARAAEGADRR